MLDKNRNLVRANFRPMKKNLGFTDKCIRMTTSITISLLVFSRYITDGAALPCFLLAFALAVTCFRGVCPIYRLFRISTNRRLKEFDERYEFQRQETLIKNYLKNYQEVYSKMENGFK